MFLTFSDENTLKPENGLIPSLAKVDATIANISALISIEQHWKYKSNVSLLEAKFLIDLKFFVFPCYEV